MNSNQYKILAAKVYSQNKNWEFGVSQKTLERERLYVANAANEMIITVLRERIAELEKEREALTEDLLETENNMASLQSRFEDIEAVFCDEDGCLIIEHFDGEGLSKWFKGNNLEQQANGIEATANKMNDIYTTEHNSKAVPPAQFGWWTRCFGYMIEQADKIRKESTKEQVK